MTKEALIELLEKHPIFGTFSILDILNLTQIECNEFEGFIDQLMDSVEGSVEGEVAFVADWLTQHKKIDI